MPMWLQRLFGLHKHEWKEIARSVVAPIQYGIHEVTFSARAKYIVGFTVIVYGCSHCQKTRTLEMPGEQQKPQNPASLHLLKPGTKGPFK